MIDIKNILLFIGIYISFFLANFFKLDYNLYKQLALPFFAPSSIVFMIIWPVIFLLITISIYKVMKKGFTNNYKIVLLINYLFIQSFSVVFFGLKSTFLAFICSLGTLISSLYLYLETKNIDKTSSKYLVPYILWNVFATILSLSIFLLNH